MRWWPVAATVSAAAFVVSVGLFALAPSVVNLCAKVDQAATCEPLVFGARSLVVGSGAVFSASLVAALYTALLTRAAEREREDSRPLVSVHARKRH